MNYTYVYFDPLRNYEPIYVGKGSGKNKRYNAHLIRTDIHPLTNRIGQIKRNGTEPLIVVFPFDSPKDASDYEVELIGLIGRKDLNKGPLLNLTDGGEGTVGWKCKADTKIKISQAMKGKPSHWKGKKRSEETKQKMRRPKNKTINALQK